MAILLLVVAGCAPRSTETQGAPPPRESRQAPEDPNLSPQPGPDTRYWQRYMADTVGATAGEFRRAYGRPNWEERTRNDQGGATETWYYTRADGQVRVVVDGDSDRVLSATALPPYSAP